MEYQSGDIVELCVAAAKNAGANSEMARSLAAATVAAQEQGKEALGVLHFFDYVDAIRAGRIRGQAVPTVVSKTAAVFVADADHGIAHVAFNRAFNELVTAAKHIGVAVFSQKDSYTCGALGYFTERLAEQGLVAIGASNSTAHLAAGGSTEAVFGTNPLSFAVPTGQGRKPLLFDQASSQTALVAVREAASKGKAIPEGWAVDEHGAETTDASAALLGALLPFGGYKGANIALMVEMLSTMAGAQWSLDAGFFDRGERSPDVGMFIIALDPEAFDPGYCARVDEHLHRLRSEFGMRFPGDARPSRKSGSCSMSQESFDKLSQLARTGCDDATREEKVA